MNEDNILSRLTAAKLKRAAAIKEKIEGLHRQLEDLLSEVAPPHVKKIIQRKRQISDAARAKISAAAKARWADWKAGRKK